MMIMMMTNWRWQCLDLLCRLVEFSIHSVSTAMLVFMWKGSVSVVGISPNNSLVVPAVRYEHSSSASTSLSGLTAVRSDGTFTFVIPAHLTWSMRNSTIRLRVSDHTIVYNYKREPARCADSLTLTKLLASASTIGAIWRIWLNRNACTVQHVARPACKCASKTQGLLDQKFTERHRLRTDLVTTISHERLEQLW